MYQCFTAFAYYLLNDLCLILLVLLLLEWWTVYLFYGLIQIRMGLGNVHILHSHGGVWKWLCSWKSQNFDYVICEQSVKVKSNVMKLFFLFIVVSFINCAGFSTMVEVVWGEWVMVGIPSYRAYSRNMAQGAFFDLIWLNMGHFLNISAKKVLFWQIFKKRHLACYYCML